MKLKFHCKKLSIVKMFIHITATRHLKRTIKWKINCNGYVNMAEKLSTDIFKV